MTTAVLYLMDGKEGGGPGSHLINLVAGLPKDEFEPHVVFLREGQLTERFKELGYPTPVMEKKFRLDLRILPRLLRFIREHGVRVVHSHTYGCNLYLRLVGRLRRELRVVTTYHSSIIDEFRGDEVDSLANRFIYTGELWMTRWSDRIIAVSQTVKQRMEEGGVPEGRIRVIHNGIDEAIRPTEPAQRRRHRAAAGLPEDGPVIGAIGRLVPLKGLDTLLRALPPVLQAIPTATVRIIGDGRVRGELEELARELGVEKQVTFTGWVWNTLAELQRMDVLAFPSLVEAHPMAALEAMGAGLPVVASDIPACRDIIRSGEEGLLFPTRDPQALASGLIRVLQDPELASRLGQAAHRRVARDFNSEQMVRQVVETYHSTLQAGRGDHR